MKVRFSSLLLTSALIFGLHVQAAERYEFYNGVRQMGMGGAVIAVVNDETALLSNPAALGKLRDHFITLFDPEVEVGAETEQVSGLNFYRTIDPQVALDQLKEKPGKRLHMKGQVFPSLIFPNFGIGLHSKYIVDGEVNEAETAYEYHYLNDWSLVGGFNFRFFNGMVKLGSNFRYTNRSEVHRTDLDPAATDLTLKDIVSEGVGVGSDVALIFAAPVKLLPTLAVVWRDVGDTAYNYQTGMFHDSATRPRRQKNSLDVGLALFPIHGKNSRTTWTVELRDVMTEDEEEDTMRRLHGGVEWNLADAFFIRAGANQKYWTAGLELALPSYQLQAASYGEEIGTKGTPREDRRYVLKFSLRF